MRRKDREKDKDFALEVLRDCEFATLATVNADGTPYCVPISPVLYNNELYFHCALVGKKLDNIKNMPKVCVSGVRHTKLVPEKFTTQFESAVATGICQEITADKEKIEALKVLCQKYALSNISEFDNAIQRSLKHTGVYKVSIEQITGKAKIYK